MTELIATVDRLTVEHDGANYIPVSHLIDPLLGCWSDDLDAGAQKILGSFLAMLPARSLVSDKEWAAFADSLHEVALTAV
jgi:hypothetical protein